MSQTWSSFYRHHRLEFPDENLVRIVRRGTLDLPRSGRVLDVGCGTGNTLLFMAREGYEAHGMEISDDILEIVRERTQASGLAVSLRRIDGTELPYSSDLFEIVISWNAVYYHGTRSRVRAAIAEFHRVLVPRGVLLLSVPHPDIAYAQRLGPDLGDGRRRFIKAWSGDQRLGSEIMWEPSSEGWRGLLSDFAEIHEGYAESDLFLPERRTAHRLFFARKGTAR